MKRIIDRKDELLPMDPYYPLLFSTYYLVLFAVFGLIFGIVGTLLVHGARFLPGDRWVVGIAIFLCGCAATISYGSQMPPTPGSISLLTSITGFLIHPLFFAAGVLVFSGFTGYVACRRTETEFPAIFLAGGITAILGGMGFYTVLRLLAPDFAIIPSLVGGVFDTAVAGLLLVGVCEVCRLLRNRRGCDGPEA
ncbi:MAG TPA: hypothetical protein ENN44_02735 [Methanoculleus sp.]|nr:hypothetical protein [Methanoculleus sp.]